MIRKTKIGRLVATDTKTVRINGDSFPVIAATEDGIPLVDLPMMSGEDEKRAARRSREAHPEAYALYDQKMHHCKSDRKPRKAQRALRTPYKRT